MTCMRAWMSLKFGQIQPWTTELATLELMKTSSPKGNDARLRATIQSEKKWKVQFEDMHESLDEFEIWPDATTGFHGNR